MPHTLRPYEFPDRVHLSLSYEIDLNMRVYDRAVYTALDWLGDIGGLMGILFDMGTLLMMFVIGNNLSYLLVSEVFKEPGHDPKSDPEYEAEPANSTLREISQRENAGWNFRMRVCDFLCARFCLKKDYQARLAKGEDRIDRELDIAQFIKRQKRQFIAFKVLFTKMERYLIQNNKTFVLHGSCNESGESESDVVSPWDEQKEWDDKTSPYFKKLLEQAKIEFKDNQNDTLDNTGYGLVKKAPNYTVQTTD